MNSKKLTLWASLVFVAAGLVGGFIFRTPETRVAVFRHPLVQYALPTYRSLRKVLDLPYAWYKLFGDDLPTYAIMLRAEDIALMNAALPEDNLKGRLTDENKVKVRADFFSTNYEDKIRIRYRGRGPNHWNAFKKSYHIDFPEDNPFRGYTALKFIIPEDRSYAVEHMNAYRAEKLGIFSPKPWTSKLEISEQDMGVYTIIPHWSTSLLEQHGFSENSNIFGIIDFELDDLKGRDFFNTGELSFWEDYTRTADAHQADFDSLKTFLSLLNAPDNIYKNTLPALVDMDALYGWLIMNTLAGSSHQNATVNIVLLRDTSTGKFHPVPWDIQVFTPRQLSLKTHPLIGRTLAIPEYRAEFSRRLEAYVLDQKNYDEDLGFYDEITQLMHTELMQDDAKAPLNFQVNQDIKHLRSLVEKNYAFVKNTLQENKENLFLGSYEIIPTPVTLSPLYEKAGESVETFISNNPGFYKINNATVGIGPGTHIIAETTILPTNITLEIKPGTTLLLKSNVSLVGWKNLIAKGTSASPIKILPLGSASWGSILIIGDTSTLSELEYVTARGGSGFHDFNITATGMISIYRSNAFVTNSTFESSNDDDALNIKFGHVTIKNNTFINTLSDGIDVDVGTGLIEQNIFKNIGGDGIDISLSQLTISKNTIDRCADKGISVGERSYPTINENTISYCAIGISSKDLSETTITQTTFNSNGVGVEAKQKKPIFGGGHATVTHSVFINNKENFVVVDSNSSIEEFSNQL